MDPMTEAGPRDAILDAVLELIDTDGYDAVQLRQVAKRAHVSLATIYKRFATRDDLIVAALESWRETNVYEGLDDAPPDESLYDGLRRVFRHIFEPWEREPRMLEAFHRVLMDPRGDRLTEDGTIVVRPVMLALFDGEDPDYVKDVLLILEHVMYGAVARFVEGRLAVTDILPLIERAAFRLTADDSRASAPASASTSASRVGSRGRTRSSRVSERGGTTVVDVAIDPPPPSDRGLDESPDQPVPAALAAVAFGPGPRLHPDPVPAVSECCAGAQRTGTVRQLRHRDR